MWHTCGGRLRSPNKNGSLTALNPSSLSVYTTVAKSPPSQLGLVSASKPSTKVLPLLKPNLHVVLVGQPHTQTNAVNVRNHRSGKAHPDRLFCAMISCQRDTDQQTILIDNLRAHCCMVMTLIHIQSSWCLRPITLLAAKHHMHGNW